MADWPSIFPLVCPSVDVLVLISILFDGQEHRGDGQQQ